VIQANTADFEKLGRDSGETLAENELTNDCAALPEIHDLKKRLVVGASLLQGLGLYVERDRQTGDFWSESRNLFWRKHVLQLDEAVDAEECDLFGRKWIIGINGHGTRPTAVRSSIVHYADTHVPRDWIDILKDREICA